MKPVSAAELLAGGGSVEYLIDGLIPAGCLAIMAGESGIGKSWLALDLAVAVATGTPVWGRFPVKRPGPVLYVDEENPKDLVKERLTSLIGARGLGGAKELPISFLIRRRVRLDLPDRLEILRQIVSDLSPCLIIFDSFPRLHELDDNSGQDVTRLMHALDSLRDSDPARVFLTVHHFRKLSHINTLTQRLKGNPETLYAADIYLACRRNGADIIVDIPKLRHTKEPPSFSVCMEELNGIRFTATEGNARKVKADRAEEVKEFVLARVRDESGISRPELVRLGWSEGYSEKDIDAARRKLETEGKIEVPIGNPKRHYLKLTEYGQEG